MGSPTFLAPGTGFMEDGGESVGGQEVDLRHQASFTCDPVPNRLWTGTSPWPWDWGAPGIDFIYLFILFLNFKIYFIDYALTVVPFFLHPPPCTLPFTSISRLSSCPQVVLVSYLASPFPTLFLTSPCLFCTYHLCFLFPVPFPPFFPLFLPVDNLPHDLHFCDSVPVMLVCLVCFCFCFVFLCSVVNSCEFVVILLVIFLIIFFYLNKSL